MKRKLLLFLLVFGLIGIVSVAKAGFGISPPDISNSHLVPGSSFEKTIYLIRGEPNEDMMAEVTIDAPEIEGWITIEKGMKFPLPKGIQQFPMKVIIDVPEDADFGNYQGYIRVRALPTGDSPGQVSTVLAGRIDVGLKVSDEGYSEFEVKGVSIPDSELGSPLTVLVKIENQGNLKTRPSKIHLDIYDLSHKTLLKSVDIEETTWVEAFETSQVEGEVQVDLELGEYWADVVVYKDGEALGINKVYFQIVEKKPTEELAGAGKGDEGLLAFFDPYLAGGMGLALVLIIIILVVVKKKRNSFDFQEEDEDDDELFPFDKETQKEEKVKKGNKKRRIKIDKKSSEE